MNSEKKWESKGEGKYAFFDKNIEIGTMDIARGSYERVAHFKIGTKEFTLKKTGSWKSTIEIIDSTGTILAKAYPEKWYAQVLKLDYEGKTFSLSVRNNPLAEYVIMENGEEILSYGLTAAEGKVAVKINSHQLKTDYIFDYLLWYLFAPIAHENMGDVLLFLLLVA